MFVFGADYILEFFSSCGGSSSGSAGSGTERAHDYGRADAGSRLRPRRERQHAKSYRYELAGVCVRAAAVGARPLAHARALDIAARRATLPPT